MRSAVFLAALGVVLAGCGPSQSQAPDPKRLVLYTQDLPRGYQYGDDTSCGPVVAEEGDWPRLRPLFRGGGTDACVMQLEWVWQTPARYSNTVTSAAYRFGADEDAERAFDARDELASFTASLTPTAREPIDLGDEAELLRGRGLNDPASAVVWRDGAVTAVLVVEPADDAAARALAAKQQRRLEQPPPAPVRRAEPELQLDDPTLTLPVYWLGKKYDPPGRLPGLELQLANVGGNGPGQSVQLWYAGGVTLDIWKPRDWSRFRRTELGRLVWDSPCTRKRVTRVEGGRAEIFAGYGTSRPLSRPCPDRPPDRALAHVYYPKVVVAVNMPYCYGCASPVPGNPYNTVRGLEQVVGALSKRNRPHP